MMAGSEHARLWAGHEQTGEREMLTRRWGTLVVVIAWVSSWGLLFVHGSFVYLPIGLASVVLVLGPVVIENYERAFDFVLFPLTRRHVRHNTRARLERRVQCLAEDKKVCRELIETATEEEATRIPVLEAERDAAEREIARLKDDIRRLEAGWKREDRERKYKELVG